MSRLKCPPSDFACIAKNCSGFIGKGESLFNYWQENDCPAAYSQVINTGPTGALAYNPQKMEEMQVSVAALFDTYFTTNQITDDVNSPDYNNFQNTLLELCINPTLPGICELRLAGPTGGTGGYCAQFTRQNAINSQVVGDFCGCYVPPDPTYLKYTLGTTQCLEGSPTGCVAGCTAGTAGCTGQPACDPLCHSASTSQKAFLPTGNIITCPQNICAINDVTINIEQSRVPGGINFNSICSGCGGPSGGDGCLCVVSGVNLSETMGSLGVGENFNDFCSGSNSVCIVENSEGVISEGGCAGISSENIGFSVFYLPALGVALAFVLAVFLVFMICIISRSST